MAFESPINVGISSGLSVAIYWIGAYVINDAAPSASVSLFRHEIVFMSYAVGVVMLPSHGSTLHRSSPNYGLSAKH